MAKWRSVEESLSDSLVGGQNREEEVERRHDCCK